MTHRALRFALRFALRRAVCRHTLFVVSWLSLAACASSRAPVTSAATPTPTRAPTATADNSANALDWPGVYLGTLPCADCSGIETAILLRRDSTYQLATRHLGKPDDLTVRHGSFRWNAARNEITFTGITDGPNRYLVGERQLVQLDLQGHRITGALADRYVLKAAEVRQPTPVGPTPAANTPANTVATGSTLPLPSSWTLIELRGKPWSAAGSPQRAPTFAFTADSARVSGFSGCNTFTGAYVRQGDTGLRFSAIAMTRRACPDMSGESEFARVLEMTDSYELVTGTSGTELVLLRARMAPLARFRRESAR
jgi:copper homeostasis protein (lipoprotein)